MATNNAQQHESDYVDIGSDEVIALTRNHLVECPKCKRQFPVSTEGRRFIDKSKLVCDPNKPDRTGRKGCGINIYDEWTRILKTNK